MRSELPPNFENLPFRRAKTAVQCISAGKRTGPRFTDRAYFHYLTNCVTKRKKVTDNAGANSLIIDLIFGGRSL